MHLRYAIFNSLILFILVMFNKKFKHYLKIFTEWLSQKQYHKERIIVFIFILIVTLVYLLKIHVGFCCKGAPGWTNISCKEHIIQISEEDTLIPAMGLPPYLIKAINTKNAQYIKKRGLLKGNGMFLHFKNGSVLPANYDLLNMSWAYHLFNYPKGPPQEKTKYFIKIIKSSLERRRYGARFILPVSIAYANHYNYHFIDYKKYPDSNQLLGISFWEITILIDKTKKMEVVGAKLLNALKVS